MTTNDYDAILFTSELQINKRDHFEKSRLYYDINQFDYIEGLKDSFERHTQMIKDGPQYFNYSPEVGPFFIYLTSDRLESIRVDLNKYISYIDPNNTCIKPTSNSDSEKGQNDKLDIDIILSKIMELENKFWKGLPMKHVIDHFIVMTEKKSDNGKVFLTKQKLVSFLRKGFLDDTTQQKQLINCSSGEKGFVIKRFYELYDLAAAKFKHPSKTENFIKLFTDCFDNWDEETIKPFFKKGKAKQKW